MSYGTLVLGESGSGKTASLRNLDPAKCLLIQPVRKPLPFRSKGWKELSAGNPGSIFVADDATRIVNAMKKSHKDIIIVDDWQYVLANLFMATREERGYDKFTAIGGAGFDIAKAASELDPDKRVYVLAHTQTDDSDGITRIKTLGKMLSEKIVVEGMFTTVLRTIVDGGHYGFRTHNSGSDTVKSPMGLFDEDVIDNDLAAVDKAICEYYGISTPAEESAKESK